MARGPRHSSNRGPSLPAVFRESREKFRADYNAAEPNAIRRRRTGLNGTADAHYANERKFAAIREVARDMCRNDFAVECTLEKAVLQACQNGFALDAATGDEKLDELLEQDWNSWAGDPARCDIQGEEDFAGIHQLARLSEFRDGDIFAVLTHDDQVQLIESDRIRTPHNALRNNRRRIVHGVELDAHRRRKALFVAKDELDPYVRIERISDTEEIAFYDEDGHRQVFQLYDRKRATQTRGITALHAVFDILSYVEDGTFAGLLRLQLSNSLAMFIKREVGYQGSGQDTKLGELEADTDDIETINPGMILRGRPGESIETMAPNIQAGDQFQYLKFLLQVLGMNLGLPLSLVTMEATKSFSGWRGEMEQAKLGFRAIQRRDEARLYRPIYVQRVKRLMGSDRTIARLGARGKINPFGHRWKTPGWPYIEPLKDAMARTERMETLQTSPRRSASEDGMEFAEVVRETVDDNELAIKSAIEAAKRLHAQTGVVVSWRELLNRRMPKGAQLIDSAEEPNVLGDETPRKPDEGDE